MKRAVIVVITLIAIAASFLVFRRGGSQEVGPYRFVAVERGDLESLVSSTGKLDAVTTVQVGTQVSGIISKIFADFNDHVTKNQVIALIDTTLLGSSLREAASNLQRNQAQLEQAERELRRIEPLYRKELVAEVDYNNAQYNLAVARASTRAAETALERATQNLEYATIRAPISGTVIERNVDVGQTVAASFSAPQLFLIANDLTRMQILASVDESDIGQIEPGQTARFTVQAYPNETFEGTVRQVRLQSTSEENVVNYTVVVDVSNQSGKLLPGMTATVDFVIQTASNVLKVSNAALRFRPTEEMIAAFREQRQREGATTAAGGSGDSAARASGMGGRSNAGSAGADNTAGGARTGASGRGDNASGSAGAGGSSGSSTSSGGSVSGRTAAGGGRPSNMTLLWYVDASGKATATPVRTGISDGQFTEITGRGIEPGMQIITSTTQTSTASSSNPFQQGQSGFRPPGSF